MKLYILLACLAVTGFSRSYAQDTARFSASLKALIADAKNEFANNMGALNFEDSTESHDYYKSKTTLDADTSFIQKDMKEHHKVFVAFYRYANEQGLKNSKSYFPVIINQIKSMIKSGNFKRRDYKTEDETSIIELKDNEGNYIMEAESTTKSLKLNIYAKSWGKR